MPRTPCFVFLWAAMCAPLSCVPRRNFPVLPVLLSLPLPLYWCRNSHHYSSCAQPKQQRRHDAAAAMHGVLSRTVPPPALFAPPLLISPYRRGHRPPAGLLLPFCLLHPFFFPPLFSASLPLPTPAGSNKRRSATVRARCKIKTCFFHPPPPPRVPSAPCVLPLLPVQSRSQGVRGHAFVLALLAPLCAPSLLRSHT